MKRACKRKLCMFLCASLFVSLSVCVLSCASPDNGASSRDDKNQRKVERSSSPISFEEGNSSSKIPFKIVDDQIVIAAKMNDTTTVDLFLDTGFGNRGVMIFDPELGKRMNLNYVSQIQLGGGGGEAIRKANVAAGVSISFPGVKFSNLQALVVTDEEPFEHLPVDGIIGGTLFDCIVEIDYDSNCLTLFDSNTQLSGDLGEKSVLSFTQGIPVVRGEVLIDKKSIPVNLIIDTGAGLPFFLFTHSNREINPPAENISARNEGLNGIMAYRLGRVSCFKVGEFVFNNTLTAFLDEKAMGAASVLGQDGFLGHQTLQKFNVVLDYSKKRMFLRRNTHHSREYEFNMAGLILNTKRDGRLVVLDVVRNSPGWEQGIKPGDIITAVNGRKVESYEFSEIYDLFIQDGNDVKLALERQLTRFDCHLLLKRII